MPELKSLLEKVIGIAHEADAAVMEIYNSGDFEVEMKEDDAQPGYISPLTKADKAANQIIEAGLKKISDYPIMSEEGSHKIQADKFWCVDPIDGTKEFIARNGEFTVNVGLVENGEPILGVVSAPAQDVIYYGAKGYGAFRQASSKQAQKITAKFDGQVPVVAVSRSHLNPETEKFLEELGGYQLLKSGSSIKFCLVADGTATLYPRLGESHLWDTAAADAILRAAGGIIAAVTTGQPLVYNPSELINPHFLVSAANRSDLLGR